jgi:hypothetical protein
MAKEKKKRPRRLEGDWMGQVTLRGETQRTQAKMFHRGHLVAGVSINEPADRCYFFVGREDGKVFKGRWWRTDMKTQGTFQHTIKDRGRRLEGTISIKGSRRKVSYIGHRR